MNKKVGEKFRRKEKGNLLLDQEDKRNVDHYS